MPRGALDDRVTVPDVGIQRARPAAALVRNTTYPECRELVVR